MTEEELIRQITREVLKQLGQGRDQATEQGRDQGPDQSRDQGGVQGPAAAEARGPKALLLYTGGDQHLDEAVAVADDLASAGAQVRILCTPSARAVLGSDRLDRLARAGEVLDEPGEAEIYEAVYWADVVAVPVLTQNAAAKWALGIRDTPATNLLAAALLMNRRVVVCPDSALPATSNGPYRAMLNDYVQKLRTFGVQTVPVTEMVRACLGESRAPAPAWTWSKPPAAGPAPAWTWSQPPATGPAPAWTWPPPPAPVRAQSGVRTTAATTDGAPAPRKLVTAADVEEAVRKGERQLTVAAGVVVTPLARDLCRNHGVALIGPDGRDGHAVG